LFGGELLLAYFEPVRLHVAAAGTAVLAAAVVLEWRRGRLLAREGVATGMAGIPVGQARGN
ncbi:MAG: hypothetical protein AABZ67_04180, partial [Pseudomonadota bacterium]